MHPHPHPNRARDVAAVANAQRLTLQHASTGPYKINGCPLRRVNQAYVIATSTTVDVSGVSVPASVNDDFFKRTAEESTEEEAGFFQAAPKAVEIPQERKDLQKAIDSALISALDNDQKGYLKARFSLKNGQYPHLMKF